MHTHRHLEQANEQTGYLQKGKFQQPQYNKNNVSMGQIRYSLNAVSGKNLASFEGTMSERKVVACLSKLILECVAIAD